MNKSKQWNNKIETESTETENQIISMESENQSDDLPHYTPQHPLPEEIKKLARDDTVCKYCGVSYLIHNEIKKLEDKLREAEKELVMLRGQEQREEALKRELDMKGQQLDGYKTSMEANNSLISSLNSEVHVLKDKIKELTEGCAEYKKKYLHSLKQLSSLTQTFRQQRKSLTDIHTKVQDDRLEVNNILNAAQKHLAAIKEMSLSEKQNLESKLQCTEMEKLVLSESNKGLTETLKIKVEELTEAQAELGKKEKLLEHQNNSLTQLQQNLSDIDQVSESLQTALKSLDGKKMELRDKETELEQYKVQLRAKSSEINDLQNKQRQQDQNQELTLQKVERELQVKEGQLSVSLKQLKTWEAKWRDQQQREADIVQQTKLSKNETEDAKDHLKQARADVEALKAEREMMIGAHQNRIEELRESFKNKMAEMDNWPMKLQGAVAAEKTRHLHEVKSLEEKLKHNFVMELQIEKDKYNELLKKCQVQERDKENNRHHEVVTLEQKYKQQLEQIQQQLTECRNHSKVREADLAAEIVSLKKIIKDLQDRFAKLDGADDGKVSDLQTKLANCQRDVSDAHNSVRGLEDKLREANEQNQFLQNIVRKECEERFELTEALSDARKELLHLKKPPGGYLAKRGSVSSLHSSSSPAPIPLTGPSPSPSEEPLLKLRGQMPTNNVKLSYSGIDNNRTAGGDRGSDAEITENRKRIASMMGRR